MNIEKEMDKARKQDEGNRKLSPVDRVRRDLQRNIESKNTVKKKNELCRDFNQKQYGCTRRNC